MGDVAEPLVVVIIANYNYSKFLEEAIQSVAEQTYKNKCVVVVDDASTDESFELVEKIIDGATEERTVEGEPVRLSLGKVRETQAILIGLQTNAGPAKARNVAVKSTWDFAHLYTVLDADNKYYPTYLEKHVAKLLEDPYRIGAVYADNTNINVDSLIKVREFREPFDATRILNHNMVFSNLLINKLVIEQCGLWDEELRFGEDLDLSLRIMEKFTIVHIPESLTESKVHSNNLSASCGTAYQQRCWAYIGSKFQERLKKANDNQAHSTR